MPLAAGSSVADFGPRITQCPTGKVCLPSRQEAKTFARANQARGGDAVYYYRCSECSKWHTTSSRREHRKLDPATMGGARSRR